MNVTTIRMPAEAAREKLDAYKAALADREATPEDEKILLGYKALAAGKQVIDLHEVFRTSPITEQKLPRLAVARASWEWCHFDTSGGFAVFAKSPRYTWARAHKKPRGHFRVPLGTMPRGIEARGGPRAIVPIIPAPIRPKGNLHRYTVLFEAEWQQVAPTDPLLLQKLGGSLYVVLAAWDLTDLERAVLAGRFVEGT